MTLNWKKMFYAQLLWNNFINKQGPKQCGRRNTCLPYCDGRGEITSKSIKDQTTQMTGIIVIQELVEEIRDLTNLQFLRLN